ncbi:MAG: hypothetical protein Q4B78_01875, partial [Bacillota bacterium]|nr:hypothetical protein [Bacillota bacterium]
DPNRSHYAFAEFEKTNSGYTYYFDAPYEGFNPVQGTSKDDSNATVIAEYYSLTKWDGAVDVSWYNETSNSFNIDNPAQFAGLAAIVNGTINNTTPIYRVKGERKDLSLTFDYDTPQTSSNYDKAEDFDPSKVNEGLPDVIEYSYDRESSLPGGVKDEAYRGVAKHDFSDRTINITADLDMGGSKITKTDHDRNYSEGKDNFEGIYPNWTPIGGEYLMDPKDGSTMIISSFNGTINGKGHNIKNLYCFRWSYNDCYTSTYNYNYSPSSQTYNNYCYSQGTGLIGVMGSLYDGEREPSIMPGVKNLGLDGYIYGRRMVGGFVGCIGGGANAASGTSVAGGMAFENLANHTTVYSTDSKGAGGIIGCAMRKNYDDDENPGDEAKKPQGSIINCYNTGSINTVNYGAHDGGIIGSNEGFDIYCCYNSGRVYSSGQKGRSIGGDGTGSYYSVNNTYYLEDTSNDENYPGYYTANLAKSVSVKTTSMTEREMKDGSLLELLNVNGKAYEAGEDGYPVLYWEKHPNIGQGNLSQPVVGGKIQSDKSGNLDNGTVVYLSSKSDDGSADANDGWKCRNFNLNGNKLSGKYLTVNGNCEVTGSFDEVVPGKLIIKDSDVCDITIMKKGLREENGVKVAFEGEVKTGEILYEGDLLMIYPTMKKGRVPENEDLVYAPTVKGFDNPYTYNYDYINLDDESIVEANESNRDRFTVGKEIAPDSGASMAITVQVIPKTTHKMWDDLADISWYKESQNEFTLNSSNELAGLSVLVDQGKTFQGKTVKLGKDISLANNDGTSGKRYWDGIGSIQDEIGFAGSFDGCGHKITDYHGNMNGLFACCKGKDANSRAAIKNVEIHGDSVGQGASGIVAKAENTNITGCASYCLVKSEGNAGGIVGELGDNSQVSGCYNYATVEGTMSTGGLAGETSSKSEILDSVNNGNIRCYVESGNIGGIVGDLNGSIRETGNYGNIKAYGRNIGGLAGQTTNRSSRIENSYNVGQISLYKGTNKNNSVGGIIGYASLYKVKNTFNYGDIKIMSGTIKEDNIGATFGRDEKKSDSTSENVYYLDSTCKYAACGTEIENLDKSVSRWSGIKKSNAAGFAKASGVLSKINGDSKFTMGGSYPVIAKAKGMHNHHSSDVVTCNKLQVCEDCGMEFGIYDTTNHGARKTIKHKEAVWNIDGYTGDVVCQDCEALLVKGEVIPAEKNREAIRVDVKRGDRIINTKSYSVDEFDSLKDTKPIGYSYGGKTKEVMVATQYVKISTILSNMHITSDDVKSIDIKCSGNSNNISAETLKACNKYYDGEENEYSAEAAFAIAWTTGNRQYGLNTIAREAKLDGTLRFGYGISAEQHATNEALGGKRFASPIEEVVINLDEIRVEYDGKICYLNEAIDSANETGGTIKLIRNMDMGFDGLEIDANKKDVILDLNGYKISSMADNCIKVISGNLIIKGRGTVDGAIYADSKNGNISAREGIVFTKKIDSDYCPSGYIPIMDKATGYYSVTSKVEYLTGINDHIAMLKAKLRLIYMDVKLKVRVKSYNCIELSYSASEPVKEFKLQRKEGDDWVDLDNVGNIYLDVAEPGIVQEYRVAAAITYKTSTGEKLIYGKYIDAKATTTLGKASVGSLKSKSRKLNITWKKVLGAKSYEVMIGTNKAISKGVIKYNRITTTKLKTKALKKNTTYYVKVRALTKNSKGKAVYGPWSTVKSIKCK